MKKNKQKRFKDLYSNLFCSSLICCFVRSIFAWNWSRAWSSENPINPRHDIGWSENQVFCKSKKPFTWYKALMWRRPNTRVFRVQKRPFKSKNLPFAWPLDQALCCQTHRTRLNCWKIFVELDSHFKQFSQQWTLLKKLLLLLEIVSIPISINFNVYNVPAFSHFIHQWYPSTRKGAKFWWIILHYVLVGCFL